MEYRSYSILYSKELQIIVLDRTLDEGVPLQLLVFEK